MTISVRMFNFIGSRTWRRVSLALLLAWTVAVMSALSAQAAPAAAPAQQVGAPVTIDFNNMSSSIVPSTYSGSQEDGYTIIPGGTVKKYRQAFPTPPFNGTILIGNGSGSTLTITRQDAGSFQFKQLDGQCSGCISAGTSLDVQGFLGNTLVGTDSYPLFLHESNPATFAAVNLAGKTIDRLVVNFHNVTGRASTDNIVLGPPAGGTIIINKRTVPAGGTGFGFTDNIAAPNTFTLDDNGSKSFLNVPAGSYTVTEDAVADTFLSSLRCDDDASATPSAVNIVTRTATIKLDAGETVTCTFTNSADDVIIIEKVTWPAGGAGFAFSSDIPGSATFTLDDFEQNIASVTPGTYTIAETSAGAGYDLTAIECAIFGPGPNDFTTVNGDINAGSVSVPLTAAGQGASCYFENTKRGSITIIKDALPADDTAFNFGINGNGGYSASFNLQDPTAPSHTESNLVPGLFNVNEAATAGWTLSNINCQSTLGASTYQYSADTGDVDVTLAPGDDVTCTFTNEKSSTLTIIKDAEPNDDLDFEFTLSGDASDSFMLDDANPDDGDGVSNSQSYTLPQGNYVVSETVPSGWVTEAPLCTSTASNIGKTSDTVFIDLASGDDVTCTFRNRKMGTITVVKDAIPADDTNFDFYVRRLPLVDETFTLQDPSAPSHTVADLAPKISYFVGEQVPAGWTLDDLVCTSALGSLTYTVDLAAGQARVRLQPGDDVTCTFKNQENKGAIVVEKRTVPAGGVNFGFAITDTVGVASSFALSDTEQYTLTNVPTGIYTVTEDAPSFGFLSGLRCDDGTSTTPSTVDIGARTAHIKLDPGETVTCTFVNTEDDLIIIEKVTWPAGGAGFGFSSDIPGSATFTLDDFGQNIASVTPGTYTITETNSGPDYDLTAIECGIFGPGPNDFTIVNGDINAGSVSVPLTAAGQGALCYFENTKRGSITVVKKASPDDDTAFNFGINGNGGYSTSFNLQDPTTPSHTESNLVPGLFNVNEAVTAGWTLSNINCQSTLGASTYQYSAATGDADVTLAPGDDVTCTFTNEKQSKLTIVKVAEPADGANFDFILGNDASDTFQLDDASPDDNDGISNSTSYTLPQGSYAITETVPAGWELTSHGCQGTFSFSAGADNTQFVVLGPGDEATCTFHNRKLGSITVVKEATPADDTPFDFALNSLVSTQSFTLQDPSAPSHTVSNLSPKRPYVVTEQLPAGWTLDDIVCTSTLSTSTTDVFPSAGGARIFLEPGDDVTCTFKNREETSITVVKETAGGDATFAFTSSALGNFNLTTTGGTTQTVFSNLAAGSYDITEQSQAGWTPADSPTCSNGADPANVTIGAGDTITCTFRNVKLASITVLKLAEGGNDTFSFSSQALGDFNLATSGGTGQQVFANLQPGAYDIFENNKAGWEIVGIPLCSNGKFPSNVTINAGDNITCTFKNRKLGSLTIVKQTQSGNGAFDFSSQTLTPTTFSLATVNGAAQRVFSDLAPNSTYDVTEQTPSGWELKSATCSDGSAPNAIRIDAGEQVTCTFVNARKSSPPTNTPTKTPTKKPTNAPTNTPAPPTHTPTPAPTQPTNGPTNTPVHTPDASTTPASTPSVTGTPPATHTPDASTTPTGTPQVTGTPDATPTPDGTPAAQPLILVSASRSGTVDGIEFHDEDILAYDPNTDQWLMVFDGSDIGWGNVDLEAFTVLADGSFLLTPSKSLSIPNLGTVTPSDIVRFVPTQLGQITAGTLEWYLDGSDVELTTTGEYIDAIAIDSTGRLVISTEGTFKFGGTTEAHDEDLTAFNANTLGMDTSGTWVPFFVGSNVALTESAEDVDAAWISSLGAIYLGTKGDFAATGSVNSLSGDVNDIFICMPLGLGENTDCDLAAFFDGDGVRFPYNIDDVALVAHGLLQISTDAGTVDGVQLAVVFNTGGESEVDSQLTHEDQDVEGVLSNRNYMPLILR